MPKEGFEGFDFDIRWRCGWCRRRYVTDDWLKLSKVPLIREDTDPRNQHGFTMRCTCGYIFGRDRWHVRYETLRDINDYWTFHVSTVFLELNHSGMWYETMVWAIRGEGIRGEGTDNSDTDNRYDYETRYRTKQEALKNHRRIVSIIKKTKGTKEVLKLVFNEE